MLDVAFPTGSNAEDVMAVLKRVNIAVFGHHRAYVRPASECYTLVKCLEYPLGSGSDLLIPECKERLAAYKEGDDWFTPPDGIQ
eukprot:3720670-Amphidinium_carterae.1